MLFWHLLLDLLIYGVLIILVIGTCVLVLFVGTRSLGLKRPVKEPLKAAFPYRAKKYFFNRSEQEFFSILNAQFDAQRYTIFPKVRLDDIIEIEISSRRDWSWRGKIRGRHIDFLVWNLVDRKLVCAIELDGSSHANEKARDVDNFKNEIFKIIGLQLHRVRVGSNFEVEIKQIRNTLQI